MLINFTKLSLKKLKYLNTNKTPKQEINVETRIIFFALSDLNFSIEIAAKYETVVVNKINTTYLTFQLM